MTFQFYVATLRHRGRDADPARVAPFLIAVDLDDRTQAHLTDRRLYGDLEAAAKRAGCGDVRRDLHEYELQLRERGGRDVVTTYAAAWRDPAGERR